jgi:hypothetical protein
MIHFLNGDSLAANFPIEGDILVCRECLIDGPVQETNEQGFFEARATYLSPSSDTDKRYYDEHVKCQFNKLLNANPASEICLWFEHDLFCQANLWFVLYLISAHKLENKIYRVMPLDSENPWEGFARAGKKELTRCFGQRIIFTDDDIKLGAELWTAYTNRYFLDMRRLSLQPTNCFKYLFEVCQAHAARFVGTPGRPQLRLKEILDKGVTDFNELFYEFSKTEGIYGFGDSQVKQMLAEMK